ncbi:MAG TPA: cytochrome c3 family protein [Candidatus Binatus sp.]|jgi:Cytochrome c7 and related cytochrome c|nr:cytochrome c3 family protein [Candidatus Binatus sp.]
MPQIFHPSTNTFSRVTIFGAVIVIVVLALVGGSLQRSSYTTEVGTPREQPVPFSHRHHVGGIGIDCRYCHTSVEDAAFAGIPPTQTCMNCHRQIWSTSALLEPVRESFRTDRSLIWIRVHDLPDFVYFDHSIHVRKGVGCATCHGRVDQMPLMWRTQTLHMEWCLDCHRHPEQYLRPRDKVFTMDWEPPADQLALGTRLVHDYDVNSMTSCSVCHR